MFENLIGFPRRIPSAIRALISALLGIENEEIPVGNGAGSLYGSGLKVDGSWETLRVIEPLSVGVNLIARVTAPDDAVALMELNVSDEGAAYAQLWATGQGESASATATEYGYLTLSASEKVVISTYGLDIAVSDGGIEYNGEGYTYTQGARLFATSVDRYEECGLSSQVTGIDETPVNPWNANTASFIGDTDLLSNNGTFTADEDCVIVMRVQLAVSPVTASGTMRVRIYNGSGYPFANQYTCGLSVVSTSMTCELTIQATQGVTYTPHIDFTSATGTLTISAGGKVSFRKRFRGTFY